MGFRWWTRKTADKLGVVGTVKNLDDGSVEVMARGDTDTLEVFADKLREGPPTAAVSEVEEVEARLPEELGSFRIER